MAALTAWSGLCRVFRVSTGGNLCIRSGIRHQNQVQFHWSDNVRRNGLVATFGFVALACRGCGARRTCWRCAWILWLGLGQVCRLRLAKGLVVHYGRVRPRLCKNAKSRRLRESLYHSRPRKNAVASVLESRASRTTRRVCVFTQPRPVADIGRTKVFVWRTRQDTHFWSHDDWWGP